MLAVYRTGAGGKQHNKPMTLTELKYIVAVISVGAGRGAPLAGIDPPDEIDGDSLTAGMNGEPG